METDEKKAKDFFNVLDAGKDILFGVAAAAVGTSLTLGAMMNKALDAAIALAHFKAETGLSAQTLQAWQHVGEAMGLTSDEITSSVVNLNKQLSMVRLGQGNIAPFQMLGISVNQSAWDVLRQLRGIIRSGAYNPATISALMSQMGLSPAMLSMLKLTNIEFDKLANRGAIFTDAQINSMVTFNGAMKELGQTITYLFGTAFADLAPAFSDVLRKTREWADLHKGDLVEGIKTVTKFLGDMVQALVNAGKIVDDFVKSTIGWNLAIKELAVGFGVLFAAVHPVYAALIGIIWAMNELKAAKEGTDTGFSKLIGNIPGFGKGGAIEKSEEWLTHGKGAFWDWVGDRAFGSKGGGFNFTQNIYGSGDPRETAGLAKDGIAPYILDWTSGQIPQTY